MVTRKTGGITVRLTVANRMKLDRIPENWNVALDHCEEGLVLQAVKGQHKVLEIQFTNGHIEAGITYSAHPDEPVMLRGPAKRNDSLLLCNTGNRIALYINERLQDEDWPLGLADLSGVTCISQGARIVIHDDFSFNDTYMATGQQETITDLAAWRPAGMNTSIGDCMPFAHDDCYRLFYLFDRRHHQSKWRLGAHQWGQVVTDDFRTWRSCPLALTIDRQEEGSICTGSLIFDKGAFYAFFAVRMSDRSPAKISCATSDDGVHFHKSDLAVSLSAPYEPVSARDPKVFGGADGQYHMLVTTSIAQRGCLAHLVSADLEHWTQLDPFVVMGDRSQPECPDYFFYNGYYYLVYSLSGRARYLIASEPFAAWKAPVDNTIGPDGLRVPKAAILNGHLVFAGFVADGEPGTYGGRFSLYEAESLNDGKLVFSSLT